MQIKIYKNDIIWNYIGTMFNMGANYIQLPFLILFLDADTLGLWYIFMSLSAISGLITFGFTPSFARNVAYCWSGISSLSKEGKKPKAKINKNVDYKLLVHIIYTCRLVYFIMAFIATLLMSSVGSIYIFAVANSIWSNNVLIGWIIFLVAVFMNIYYSYYSAILIGIGGVKENNQAIIISNIIRVVLLIVMLSLGFELAGACFSFLVYGFILRYLCKIKFESHLSLSEIRKKYNLKVSIRDVVECFTNLWANAWKDGMVSVSDYISTQAGTLICSAFLTLEDTGVFSIVSQVAVAIAKISRSLYSAYLPVIQSAFIHDDKKQIKITHTMCVAGYIVVFLVGFIGMGTIGLPFIKILKPNIEFNIMVYIGMSLYQFMISFRNCYAAFLSATNRMLYWKSYIVSGIIYLFLEFVLLKYTYLRIWAIITASIASELIYNIWHWPRMINNELELKLSDYYGGLKDFFHIILKDRCTDNA